MTDHQVIHGDACEVLPALGVQADLILTSPPYGEMRTFGGHEWNFDRMADACVAALKPGGVLVWQVGDYKIDGSETCEPFRQVLAFRGRGLRLHDTMIFEKSSALAWAHNQYNQAFEYMFVFSKDTPKTANLLKDRRSNWAGTTYPGYNRASRNADGSRDAIGKVQKTAPKYGHRTNIWRYSIGGKHSQSAPDFVHAHDHPAIFPLALAKDHITTWTNPGDLVLDPMAGSGTVSRAAKDLGRNSVAIEIHEPYVDLIRRRMAQEVWALV